MFYLPSKSKCTSSFSNEFCRSNSEQIFVTEFIRFNLILLRLHCKRLDKRVCANIISDDSIGQRRFTVDKQVLQQKIDCIVRRILIALSF